ncbi:hypothetical protein RM574_11780 [Streptomyces sp. DSM 41982]|uniref:Uncharacterized protein n=1 Tax=Streptomyces evansiae TaxID=3075535 RepID=A0ABD5E570_9ACTN|nr:hypothetical protein [Streptomyces sp. DSM 41982]MDT0416171.1 hypothetical protein [Streptomyces sp. DSM 41982]
MLAQPVSRMFSPARARAASMPSARSSYGSSRRGSNSMWTAPVCRRAATAISRFPPLKWWLSDPVSASAARARALMPVAA